MPRAEPLREGDPAAVGPYRLLGRLGAGGQGVVYLASAPDGRPVAVKVLREGQAGGRFLEEIDAARRVEPFCVAQVLDASPGDRPYIVTEYVEGPSLQQAGRHAGADLQRLAVATATALAAIHQAGIVHRDFKPANVLLGHGGPRVIDFGIARSAEAGAAGAGGIVGTPAYMAPEQLAGAPVGPAADVFAWGSAMGFAATGSPPFGEDTLPAVINRILHNEPQLGELPQPLRAIVLECLAKDPARRPSMEQVLLRLLGGRAVAAAGPGHAAARPAADPGDGGPGSALGRPGRRVSKGRWVAGAAAVALAVAGGVVWAAMNGWVIERRRPPAEALALSTGTTPAPTATPGHAKRTGKPSTPRPGRKSTSAAARRPTLEPSRQPTRKATSTASTGRPTRSAGPSGGGSFRVLSIRAQSPGTDTARGCHINDTNTFGVVEGTRLATTFRYEWVLDGQVKERSEAPIAESHTFQLVGPLVKTEGPHTVILRVTGPTTSSKTLRFTICPDDDQ
ncbi:serine/threonine-protein kinase [Nonomuraea rhodomycinica]|uniref:Serine/threonine protein kinase n=1 Tax=Nonomuraea rhodomycinica TaxID=1712872 RepID=A0A7Y6IJL6_9ACTN|nr:serine/threonine-protein kinase [Nonomuraea rhodomycinica]NUW39357.1 serine/threonine protein kinase [Nonomuraea rhodomycinica]